MTQTETQSGHGLSRAESRARARALRRAMLADFWFYFSQNKGAVIGLAVFVFIVVIAVLAPVFAPHDPTLQNRQALLLPPFWEAKGTFPLRWAPTP